MSASRNAFMKNAHDVRDAAACYNATAGCGISVHSAAQRSSTARLGTLVRMQTTSFKAIYGRTRRPRKKAAHECVYA
eukprot:6189321-Pleurochrysis_carterae.AAC.1